MEQGLYPQQLPQTGDQAVIMALNNLAGQVSRLQSTGGYIAAGSVGGAGGNGKIAADSVTTAEIQAGTIQASDIATGTLTASQIAAGSITGDRLVAGTLTATQIAANAITAVQIAAGALDAKTITGSTIRTSASNPKVQMDGTGFYALDASGTVTFKADAATGKIITLAGIGGANLVKNAGFEDGGLSQFSSLSQGTSTTTIATETAAANIQQGTRALKVTATAAGLGSGFLQQLGSAAAPIVKGGERVVVSVYAKSTAARTVRFELAWFDASNNFLTTSPITSTVATIGGTYARFVSDTGTAPANAVYCNLRIWAVSPALNEVFYFDSVQVELGEFVTGWAPKPDEILPAQVGNTELATGAVDSGKVQDGTITGTDLAVSTITANNIAAGTITATQLAANSVTATQIATGALDAKTITAPIIRTAASGERVELSGTSIKSYDASGNVGLEIMPSHPAPIMRTSQGSQQTVTPTWATWITYTGANGIYVPSGKTLFVIGGVTFSPSGSGTTSDTCSVRALIAGLNVGQQTDITMDPTLASGLNSATAAFAWINSGAGTTIGYALQVHRNNTGSSPAYVTVLNSGWIFALVF